MKTDQLTAIARQGEAFQWTTIRRGKGGASVAGTKTADIPAGEDGPDLAAGVQAVRKKLEDPGARLCLVLPAERVLLRVMNFPSVDPDELQGMVDLQVGKISPFPVDNLSISYEVLAQQNGNSHVLIAAVPGDVVEELGRPWMAARMKPQRVDVDILGYWHLLWAQVPLQQHGRDFVLFRQDGHAALIAVQDGIPIQFRSLISVGGLSEESRREELVEDLAYTLTAVEAEWGESGSIQLKLLQADVEDRALADAITAELGMPCEVHGLSELPPLSEGVARRFSDADSALIDLAPATWRQRIDNLQTYRRMMLAGAALLAVWLAGVIGVLAWDQILSGRLNRLEADVEAKEGPAEQIKRMRSRVQAVEQYADRTQSALESLREVSSLLPADLDLLSFNYRMGEEVSLRGTAKSISKEPIIDFIQRLEQSEFFGDVEDQQVTTRTTRGRRISEFRIRVSMPSEEDAS